MKRCALRSVARPRDRNSCRPPFFPDTVVQTGILSQELTNWVTPRRLPEAWPCDSPGSPDPVEAYTATKRVCRDAVAIRAHSPPGPLPRRVPRKEPARGPQDPPGGLDCALSEP